MLGIIHRNPGKNALQLRDFGIRAADGRTLSELERNDLIVYRNGGWHLTSKGDLRLAENTPDKE